MLPLAVVVGYLSSRKSHGRCLHTNGFITLNTPFSCCCDVQPITIMSTRLILKNLPKNADEARVRELFKAKGDVTDVKVLRTKYEPDWTANRTIYCINQLFCCYMLQQGV